MPHRIRDGLVDYLEVMQMAGLDHLTPPLPGSWCERNVEPVVEPAAPSVVDTEIQVSPENEMPRKNLSEKTKVERLALLAGEVSRCARCEELALTRTRTVFGVGDPNARLVFLGEAPGADEDKQGEPFVGRAGKLLNDIITKGMRIRREDVYICNVLRCRPPGNRNPKPEEAEHCRGFLDRTLEIVGPEFICCLGAVAAQNLLLTDKSIGSMRGKILEYKGVKVVCTYHPAYLLRNPAAKKQAWEDIQLLMREMKLLTPDS